MKLLQWTHSWFSWFSSASTDLWTEVCARPRLQSQYDCDLPAWWEVPERTKSVIVSHCSLQQVQLLGNYSFFIYDADEWGAQWIAKRINIFLYYILIRGLFFFKTIPHFDGLCTPTTYSAHLWKGEGWFSTPWSQVHSKILHQRTWWRVGSSYWCTLAWASSAQANRGQFLRCQDNLLATRKVQGWKQERYIENVNRKRYI